MQFEETPKNKSHSQMTTFENMPDGIIPFPYGQTLGHESTVILQISIATVATVAALSSLLIIVAIYKAGPYQDSKFLISLCIADLLFSTLIIIMTLLNIPYGGFAIGKTGCAINAGLIFVTAGAAVFSLAGMAINMYLVLIRRVYMSDWQKDRLIIGLWIFLISLAASFLSTDYRFKGVALAPSGDYCFLAFWSSDPVALLANSSAIFALVVAFAIMTHVYTTIYLMYIKTACKKAKKSEKNKTEFTINQKKLFFKAFSVCGAFCICWFPQLIVIATEMITQSTASYAICIVADMTASMEGIVNAVVLYRHDRRIKREINTMISDLLTNLGLEFYMKPSVSPSSPTSPQGIILIAQDQSKSPNIELAALNLDRAIALTVPCDTITVKM